LTSYLLFYYLIVKSQISIENQKGNQNEENIPVEENCEIVLSNAYLKKHLKFPFIQKSYDHEIVESMLNVIIYIYLSLIILACSY